MTTKKFPRRSVVSDKNVESWLIENESKLRQYARALVVRDTGSFFEEGDFFQSMCTKIFMQSRMTNGFMDLGDGYLFKTAWNEGLMMIRRQRQYAMHIQPVLEAEEDNALELLPSEGASPEELHISANQQELIASAIASLPEKSRQVCVMLYAGERPADIARKLGLKSRATINYHVEKARAVFMEFGLQAG